MRIPAWSCVLDRLRPALRLGAALMLAVMPLAAKGPPAPQRLTLESLGVQPLTGVPLAQTGALTTVHFIDEQHLLVTFNVRRLMKRHEATDEDDNDRTIKGIVVHLPSGKVLAEAEWRVHDTRQYLWELGHGRFLLRVRDTLTTMAPLANLKTEEPFAQQPFLNSERRVLAVVISAERDLATVETMARPPHRALAEPAAVAGGSTERMPTQINFYRLIRPEQPRERMIVQSAGIAIAKGTVDLPVSAAGFLEVLQESANRWLFDFNSYDGKYIELSPFDTTCRPRPTFVSASEFVAFGCLGNADHLAIGGFNMQGKQMWQQNFSDLHAFPNFSFAAASGRFALSRNIVSSPAGITVEFAPTDFTTQEIRVYQGYSGKQLLRVEALPVQRMGQNYDLSPEGKELAVIRDGAIEVHTLPPLSRDDEKEVRAAREQSPRDKGMAVNLAPHAGGAAALALVKPAKKQAGVPVPEVSVEVGTPSQVVAPAAALPTPAAIPATAVPVAAAATPAEAMGDAAPEDPEPRKPPTLYTLPTDKYAKPQK